MSHSLPSKEVYVVDVPEIKNFAATFEYNFFVPDESVNATSGVPDRILYRRSADEDADYTQYLETRVPRFVRFSWNRPRLSDPGRQVIESDMRKHSQKSHAVKTVIADNYKKIVAEDHFSTQNFIAVSFHDGDIDNKIYNFVSGSYEQLTLDQPKEKHVSHNKMASHVHALVPKHIDPVFVTRALSQPKLSHGATHFVNNRSAPNKSKIPVFNSLLKKLTHVYINAQINAKLFHDITGRNVKNPHSPFSLDMHDLHKVTRKLKAATGRRFGHSANESEYKALVPFISMRVDRTSHHAQRVDAEIVGYVIDKYEISRDGTIKQLTPVIIENADAHSAIDAEVKYGQKYCYSMRTIALFHLPAIDAISGEIATLQVLISSKPTVKQYVEIHDTTAPPVPTDINFTWNYETNKLLVHWTFPPNEQRDVKKFQVFRRKDTDRPFELLKEYDFDDSAVKAPPREQPHPRLIERLRNPVTFYVDDDFTMDSRYIYTVCCIDAHGLTSCYGAQYEVSFDRFKNTLRKSLVSHSGAPKPYPNLYLDGTGFVNVAHVHGPHSKKLTLYFVPQFYQLEDEKGRVHRVLATNQTGGSYKFQFLNTDNQKSQTLTVKIDDRVRVARPKISFPTFRFNKQMLTK